MGVTFIAKEGTYTAPATLTTKTITENGTYSAVDDSANGYSSVVVNVEGGGGSSDFSTAEVTLDNSIGLEPLYFNAPSLGNDGWIYENEAEAGETAIVTIPLYKSKSMALYPIDGYEFIGNIIYDSEDDVYYATGDFTIRNAIYNITVNSDALGEGTLEFVPYSGTDFAYYPIINGEIDTQNSIQIDLTNTVSGQVVQIGAVKVNPQRKYYANMNVIDGVTPTVSGDITWNDDEGWSFLITGNGTITLTIS